MSIAIQKELICLLNQGIVTGITPEVKETRVFLFWQMNLEIVPRLKKCHLLFDLLINPTKLENLFNFSNVNLKHLGRNFIWKLLMLSETLILGNMTAKKNGAPYRILKLNDKALNVHYFNHWFNLVIAKSCNIQKVQNLMGIIKEISYFLIFCQKDNNCWKMFKIIWCRYYKRKVNGGLFNLMGCFNWWTGSFWNFWRLQFI